MFDAEQLRAMFGALANEDRLLLVDLIARGIAASSVGADARPTIAELALRVGISRFSASRHLAILRDSGLIEGHRNGVRSEHTLNRRAFEQIEDWLYPIVDAANGRTPSAVSGAKAQLDQTG